MSLEQQEIRENQLYKFLLITGIILVAFNLRPAITSVGPLMSTIRDDLGLSNWSVGLLTSLPLIVFAIMSPISAKLGNRYSNEVVMLFGLIFIIVGIATRSASTIILLFAGTLLIGVGIAVCNVLLPGVIKDKFPLKVGLMTSVYSTSMGVLAAAASGISFPLASNYNLGWQLALLIWAIPAFLAMIVWLFVTKNKQGKSTETQFLTETNTNLWRSPLAWQIAFYMGFQSFQFYVVVTWLPEILHSTGMTMETAGWMLSFTQFIGIPASFIVPVLAGKFASQRILVVIMGAFSVLGYSGLLLGTNYVTMLISIIFIGIALSGTFSLALTFLGLRAKTAKQSSALSGMAQAFGYILAAVGPIFIGYLFDLTKAWTTPIVTLIITSILVIVVGLGAGRNKYV
ncbi:CynX/NimT family MFS transporter [Ornithinibacillus halotolerans]|uniref:Transporter YycB n=1 Tax=Ornithinibacillus halotolerans TaxID=1274357 RepID=A0A916RRM8_9BACI|nr:MFS transporter [Ornithinibacillus halotolerans]GGA66939.1 putative transporter YycB [Ornithinibacillus halotolerans]